MAPTKQFILHEIARTARENGGVTLGTRAFARVTGIKESDWKGKIWARWSDAIREAGFQPNQMTTAFDESRILESFIGLMRELGRFPVRAEIQLKKRSDSSFPNWEVFHNRFGSKRKLAQRILEYCRGRAGYEDVAPICTSVAEPDGDDIDFEKGEANRGIFGFVYLVKAGRFHKIGRSNSAGRREYELAIQLPEKAKTVHTIRTDDPTGIEEYWHKRFALKRKNGEWFELDSNDVAAFRRRKFM